MISCLLCVLWDSWHKSHPPLTRCWGGGQHLHLIPQYQKGKTDRYTHLQHDPPDYATVTEQEMLCTLKIPIPSTYPGVPHVYLPIAHNLVSLMYFGTSCLFTHTQHLPWCPPCLFSHTQHILWCSPYPGLTLVFPIPSTYSGIPCVCFPYPEFPIFWWAHP